MLRAGRGAGRHLSRRCSGPPARPKRISGLRRFGQACRQSERVSATQRWLDDIVIGEKLCPFAPPVRSPPRLRLVSSRASCADDVVAEVAKEAALLVEGLRQVGGSLTELPETTLLVLDEGWEFVAEWRDLVRLSWRLQAEAILDRGYAADVQLVLFHPKAAHSAYAEGAPDPADYSIRAPHPTVHLLREADVLQGVKTYPGADQIPHRNKVRLRALGTEACAEQLAACYGPSTPRGDE